MLEDVFVREVYLVSAVVRWLVLAMPLVALMALAVLVAGGCGAERVAGGGETAAGGEDLVVGYDQEPDILNPFIVGGETAATGDMVAGILEKPYEVQPDLTLAPELAEGEPRVLSKNPLVIEYRLKEGLTFSDGEPLTSADVKFTYRAIRDKDNSIISREGWDEIESVETPDEQTVRITFSEPYAAWRDLISGPQSAILPRHVYRRGDFNEVLNENVVGSGPYVLQEWNKGQNIILEENPNYWGEPPAISRITFRVIPDADELTAALQSGEVSFINPPLKTNLEQRLESYEGAQVESAAGTFWEHLAFNTNKVDNLKLRRAVAYGIDREQILDETLPGRVEPLDSVLVPEQELFYVPAWEEYGFDPERARRLVREARSEGAATTISFTTIRDDELRSAVQKEVRRQLEEVGITVETDNAASPDLFAERLPAGEFQMGEWAWLATPEPQLDEIFGINAFPPEGQNYYRYKDQEASWLVSQAGRTVEVEERARLLKQAQEVIADDLPVIPLYQRPIYYAYDENLQGPEVNPTLAGPFWNIGEWSLREQSAR